MSVAKITRMRTQDIDFPQQLSDPQMSNFYGERSFRFKELLAPFQARDSRNGGSGEADVVSLAVLGKINAMP